MEKSECNYVKKDGTICGAGCKGNKCTRHKDDKKEKRRLYIQANKEKIQRQNKEYREKNAEQLAEKAKESWKEYYETNKEAINEKKRKYHAENKEKEQQYNKKYRETHKDKIQEYNRKKYNQSILKNKVKSLKQCDKVKGRSIIESDFITVEWIQAELTKQNNTCCYCSCDVLLCDFEPYDKKQFSVDRIDNILPHHKSNCKISCLECNLKRSNL